MSVPTIHQSVHSPSIYLFIYPSDIFSPLLGPKFQITCNGTVSCLSSVFGERKWKKKSGGIMKLTETNCQTEIDVYL